MHTINHVGHVNVYPDAFGLEPDSSLLSDAMDVARGGQFVSHPSNYPEEAWLSSIGGSAQSSSCMVLTRKGSTLLTVFFWVDYRKYFLSPIS